jgi:raffinose/stachyose/melibiose transport system permease protein
MVLYTSLCNYTVSTSPVWIGLQNFRDIFSDSDFLVSIGNTLKWVVIQSTLHVLLGFTVALVLRRKPKGWTIARTAYMIPNIIPTAATGVMFTLLLNPMFGILKPVYEAFGMDTAHIVNLFGNSKYAFWTVTATWVFYSGFNTIIFLAEMGAIDKEIYEAARVDGATPWQMDRYITIPMMKNIFGTCVTLASVAMVSQFDIIYMTTKGGPGNATLNLPIYLYKIVTLENNYGKANAVGVVQIILGLTLVILIRRLFRQKGEE